MNEPRRNDEISLALQHYLLGEITDNIFAITFGYEGTSLDIVFFTYHPPSSYELGDLGAVGAELVSDSELQTTDVELYFVPLNECPPKKLFKWVFLRKDPQVASRIDPYDTRPVNPRIDFAKYSESAWLSR